MKLTMASCNTGFCWQGGIGRGKEFPGWLSWPWLDWLAPGRALNVEGDSPAFDGALPMHRPCTYGLKFADIDGVVVAGGVVLVGYLAIEGEMDETLATVPVHFIIQLRQVA